MSRKDRITFQELNKNNKNIYNLEWKTVQSRLRKGYSLEQAISKPVRKLRKVDLNKKRFEELNKENNPYNLTWKAVESRIRNKGLSLEEAMSYPARIKVNKNREEFEKHPNPYNLKWKTVQSRIKNGETLENALNRPLAGKSDSLLKFEELNKLNKNKYNLSWSIVKSRINKGYSLEEAMNSPLGYRTVDKYLNGWVYFEGEWTNVEELIQIFNDEVTINMIKSGVKIEKLFRKG